MSILYARTRLRRERREQVVADEQESLNRRVNLMLRTRLRTTAVANLGGLL